jgi:hypothetical protein
MRQMKLRFSAIAALAAALCAAPAIYGQATTGTISGTVTDASGASVPAAAVTVRNLDTNVSRNAATESDGRFRFPALTVGRYEVTVEAKGFAKHVRGPIGLVLNQEAVIGVELQTATLTETVTVSSDAAIIDTTTAEVGVRFDEKRLKDLPISGQFATGGGFRDVFAAVLSAPGVSQINSGNSNFSTGTNFSANGVRLRGNNFMVDGQDMNEPGVSGRAQWINNTDTIQEIRLITNQPMAEYGRAAGSVVNAITRGGTNSFHGSAFEYYNGNKLNSRSNTEKAAGFQKAPYLNEHQYGGTAGGRIIKDKTFFFGSLQRWTQRLLGAGSTVAGVPTAEGKTTLQNIAGSQPQVAALLKFVPAGTAPFQTAIPVVVGGQTYQIPTGSVTSSASAFQNNWQASGRVDHHLSQNHTLAGRYLFNDNVQGGQGQLTPPGLTSANLLRTQAASAWLNSTLSPSMLNEFRASYQRYSSSTVGENPEAETIPSVEIPQLGLTGFNAAASRTGIGLAVNFPQFRINNTYQIQENFSWTKSSHSLKFGADLRRLQVKSFFVPTTRGRLQYDTLQTLINDVASVANINKPLPGGEIINYYKWDDYYFFVQDSWRVSRSLTLNLGLRYELPGNSFQSLYDLNDRVLAGTGNQPVFRLTPRPGRDTNNFQPRFGFAWNPHSDKGILGFLTGGNRLVVRGGYARTNDYGFLNINLNIASAFPFILAANVNNLTNAWTQMPQLFPNLSNPAELNLLNRTIVADDFRAPIAEQFSFEVQRELDAATVLRVGYIGTKGTALFQTIDGNPRTLCDPIPTNAAGVVQGCSRVDATAGVVRLRANAAASIYHSMQVSMERRFSRGFTGGAHYTWSSFIDTASEIFNPSARGEVAVAQNSYDRNSDRGRSTYDRPHRFSTNFVYELPTSGITNKALRAVAHGWQFGSFITLQSGSPFSALNGSDPTLAVGGIDGLVGQSIRPNVNTTLDLSNMSVENMLIAGGRNLFSTLPTCARIGTTNTCTPVQRFGNAGRNILRSDGIANLDFSIAKTTYITERHRLMLRADFFNSTNTRNFGIPEARVNNSGFANQWGTDGGNRRIFVSLKYQF